MKLTAEERRMLKGEFGPAAKEALALQIEIGKFFGAKRFVPVSNVHMMGDIEVMGDAGHAFLERMAGLNARCIRNTTTNARCVDFDYVDKLGQTRSEAEKERQLIGCLRRMDVVTADTCINYQTLYQPHKGEHVAWGDTGTVIYANSVFGARSNFESGPVALAAALTGRVPEYGFHLDQHRKGSFQVNLKADLRDVADWGAVGKIVGSAHQDYFAVPVFNGVKQRPGADQLKHLGAALASYGSMGMFHMVGVTPEAPTLKAAFAGNKPKEIVSIANRDIARVYADYSAHDNPLNLVVFSGPQQSLFEMKTLAALLEGRTVKAGSQLFITTSNGVKSAARKLGYLDTIEAAGGVVLEGVCFYILQNIAEIRARNGWSNLVTNSAKLANIISAHKFNTILRRTQACIEIACTGEDQI
ncbi:MAG: aconitase X catalytic domain-containing protein [Betaproteobacteria bacterium]|nr:aconitase X catalytic domain-containing protein [Betaproteobacteria bacterium]